MFSNEARIEEEDKSENVEWQIVIRGQKLCLCLCQEDQDDMGENDEGQVVV